MNFLSLLAENAAPVEMEVLDRLVLGLEVAGIGILVVFGILLLIIGVIKLLQLSSRNPGKYTEPAKRAVKGFFHKLGVGVKSVFVKKNGETTQSEAVQKNDGTIFMDGNEEIVAAIVAALTSYYDQENEKADINVGFKVRSIKRF